MKLRKSILVLFFSLFSLSLAVAQPGGYGQNRMHPHHGPRQGMWFFQKQILKDMGVAQVKINQMDTIMDDLRKTMFAMQTDIRKIKISIREELYKDNLDDSKLDKLFLQLAEIRKQQQLLVERSKLKTHKLLTPEQRKKLLSALDQRRKQFWKYMRPGFKRGFDGPEHMEEGPDNN